MIRNDSQISVLRRAPNWPAMVDRKNPERNVALSPKRPLNTRFATDNIAAADSEGKHGDLKSPIEPMTSAMWQRSRKLNVSFEHDCVPSSKLSLVNQKSSTGRLLRQCCHCKILYEHFHVCHINSSSAISPIRSSHRKDQLYSPESFSK